MHDSNILHSLPSFTNPERALNNTLIKGKSTSYIGIATLLLSALLTSKLWIWLEEEVLDTLVLMILNSQTP